MKISEVAIPKKVHSAVSHAFNNSLAPSDIDKKLREMGWFKSGEGMYSDVYENASKSYILKINRSQDLAFDDFVKLTHKFKNKHFPKISDQKEINIDGRKYYIYAIEKLYPLDEYNGNRVYFLIHRFVEYYSILGKKLRNPNFNDYPELKKALEIITKNNRNHGFDMHRGNVMQRKDGTVVIIDPYN